MPIWTYICPHGTSRHDLRCVQRKCRAAAAAESRPSERARASGQRACTRAKDHAAAYVEAPARASRSGTRACPRIRAAAALRPRRARPPADARVGHWVRAVLERELRSAQRVREETSAEGACRWQAKLATRRTG